MLAGILLATLLTTPATALQSQTQLEAHAERVLIRGLTFMQTGFPDKAVVVFAEGLKVNPTHPVLLASMSDAQKAMGDYSSALFYIEGAISELPDDPGLHRQALTLAVESGNAELAIRESEALLRLSPDMSSDYLLLLFILSGPDQGALAVPVAEQAAARFPGSEELLRVVIETFERAGNLERTEWAMRKLLVLTADPEDRYELSRILILASKWEDAADELVGVLTEDPSHVEALLSLSTVQAFLPDRNLEAELPRGMLLQQTTVQTGGENVDSLAVYRAIVEKSPEDDDSALDLAKFLARTGEYRELEIFTAEQIERDPRQIQMWILAIRSRVQTENWGGATTFAEDSVLLFPGHEPLEIELVEVLAQTERYSEAMELARDLMGRVDDGSEIHQRLLRLVQEMDQPQ